MVLMRQQSFKTLQQTKHHKKQKEIIHPIRLEERSNKNSILTSILCFKNPNYFILLIYSPLVMRRQEELTKIRDAELYFDTGVEMPRNLMIAVNPYLQIIPLDSMYLEYQAQLKTAVREHEGVLLTLCYKEMMQTTFENYQQIGRKHKNFFLNLSTHAPAADFFLFLDRVRYTYESEGITLLGTTKVAQNGNPNSNSIDNIGGILNWVKIVLIERKIPYLYETKAIYLEDRLNIASKTGTK